MITGARAWWAVGLVAVAFNATAALPSKIDGMSKTTQIHAQQALACSQRMGRNPDLLIVADMRLPSSARRLWAIDTHNSTVVLRTEVAHGRGSDPTRTGKAQMFSNTPGSLMPSLGLYQVSEAYRNSRDGSTRRRLDGMMYGFNDTARDRAVVLHPASYVRTGWAGMSEGCPAVSYAVMDALEDRGLDNAVLWVEGDDHELDSAIASCAQSKPKHRFRWFWQSRSKPRPTTWAPLSSEMFNPVFDIQAEGMCLQRNDWVWSGPTPVFAQPTGTRWPLLINQI